MDLLEFMDYTACKRNGTGRRPDMPRRYSFHRSFIPRVDQEISNRLRKYSHNGVSIVASGITIGKLCLYQITTCLRRSAWDWPKIEHALWNMLLLGLGCVSVSDRD